MSGKQYDYKGLVRAYADAQRYRDRFRGFYKTRLEKLETLFEIYFDQVDDPLRHLFSWTVGTYCKIQHPYEGILEYSSGFKRLDALGEAVNDSLSRLSPAIEQCREAHLEVLNALFVCMFGEVDKLVTSDDLRALGFDDTEPDPDDFF